MLRSLVFTALLEHPEFRAMEYGRGGRLVTDAVARVEDVRATGSLASLQVLVDAYVAEVTSPGGGLERYVDTLLAGDRRQAADLGVENLPPGLLIRPARG